MGEAVQVRPLALHMWGLATATAGMPVRGPAYHSCQRQPQSRAATHAAGITIARVRHTTRRCLPAALCCRTLCCAVDKSISLLRKAAAATSHASFPQAVPHADGRVPAHAGGARRGDLQGGLQPAGHAPHHRLLGQELQVGAWGRRRVGLHREALNWSAAWRTRMGSLRTVTGVFAAARSTAASSVRVGRGVEAKPEVAGFP